MRKTKNMGETTIATREQSGNDMVKQMFSMQQRMMQTILASVQQQPQPQRECPLQIIGRPKFEQVPALEDRPVEKMPKAEICVENLDEIEPDVEAEPPKRRKTAIGKADELLSPSAASCATLIAAKKRLEEAVEIRKAADKSKKAADETPKAKAVAKTKPPAKPKAVAKEKTPAKKAAVGPTASTRPDITQIAVGAPITYLTGLIYVNEDKNHFRVFPDKAKFKFRDHKIHFHGDKSAAWIEVCRFPKLFTLFVAYRCEAFSIV